VRLFEAIGTSFFAEYQGAAAGFEDQHALRSRAYVLI
jgi:hypothetical protein